MRRLKKAIGLKILKKIYEKLKESIKNCKWERFIIVRN